MTRTALRGLALLVLAGAPTLHAQDSTPPRPDPFAVAAASGFVEPASTGFGVYAENDMLGFSTDQNYTGGFAFSLGGRWIAEAGITGPLSLLDRVTQMRRVHGAREVTQHTLTILGAAFTPRRADLAITTPIVADRPYASLFGFQTRRVSVIRKDDDLKRATRAYTSQLTIAALGWNLAKALQTDLHRSIRKRSGKATPVDPLGWHNQISNGGEPTLLYGVGVEQLLAGSSPVRPGVGGQATWNALANVGYYNNAAVGVAGRWGRISSNFWEFSSNPLSSVQERKVRRDDSRPWELYGFGAVRGKAVVYNVLMQGQFRESAHTFSSDQVNRALLEGEAGVVGARTLLGGTISARVMAAGRSPEFSGPRSRSHTWGAIHLSYAQRLPTLTQ